EDGAVHGLTAIEGRSERAGLLPMSTVLKATDVRGKTFAMTAAAINGSPWAPYPSLVYVQNLMRWNLDGEIGYGVQQDVMSRAYLTRHRDALRHV
ncbi:MAG: hypothetical protein KDC98_22315, partial [Planctomycetes bacterium]|nr:hypothetical protein [Planctomycetota bacterium]